MSVVPDWKHKYSADRIMICSENTDSNTHPRKYTRYGYEDDEMSV